MTSDTKELSYLWHNDGKDDYVVWVKVSPTSVHMMSPMRKETTDIPRISSSRRYPLLKVSGYMSTTAVTKLSTHTNCRRRGDLIKTLKYWKHSVQSRFIISIFFNLHVFNRDPLFFFFFCWNWQLSGTNHPHSWVHVLTEEESETLNRSEIRF